MRFALSVIVLFFSMTVSVLAGSLEPPAKPSEPASAMFTLEDLYNRLNSGVAGSKRSGGFVRPTAGPGVVGKSINDVMTIAPKKQVNGVKRENVACGKTFFGLRDGAWGQQMGIGGCPPPTDVKVTASQNKQAIISWSPVTGAKAYHLYVATQAGLTQYNYTELSGTTLKQNVSSPYTLTGLTNGVTYYLTVATETAAGEGLSAAVTTTPAFVRFTANSDGTVTDHGKGLLLLKNANCFGAKSWTEAVDAVVFLAHGQCGLTDNSKPGQWRMLTKDESSILFDAKTDAAFTAIQTSGSYWSSTSDTTIPSNAWSISLSSGSVTNGINTNTYYVWPVRGIQ